ncbi:L-proline trans-4-hydroxylase-like [Lytechinus pictus]|uniref:L-proline trans-4-hydroxylase-like n=1 Tax=Lytechinus pictus TaxID=7653 RepID=UPI0030B9C280
MRAMSVRTDFEFSEDLDSNPEVLKAYNDRGYFIVRSLLSGAELTKLQKALDHDEGITKHGYEISDGHGRNTKIVIWSHPGNDITGMIARSQKVAGTSEKLLGGESYHYHTKMIMKEPRTGGSFVWHQDYGYWYKNGCLFPDMMTSVFIAVDKCDKENGCLQIIPGSHKLGRIEHEMVGGQTGANLDRVEFAKKQLGFEFVELNAGDGIFFHCNLLHCSSANNSDRRRWSFILAYNRKDNDPVIPHHHPQYTPMTIVPNSAILECSDVPDMTGKDFLDPKNDKTVKAAPKEQ